MHALPYVLLTAIAGVAASVADAASIHYAATPLGGTSWRYDYSVANDSLGAPLEEFTIQFAVGSYTNLAVAASPPGWDSLVVQPDAGIPDAGFFDSLALGTGLAPGHALAGFAVTFDFLGGGVPGPQAFDVVDPESFAILHSGVTAVVPAPPAILLLLTGLLALGSRLACLCPDRRRRW